MPPRGSESSCPYYRRVPSRPPRYRRRSLRTAVVATAVGALLVGGGTALALQKGAPDDTASAPPAAPLVNSSAAPLPSPPAAPTKEPAPTPEPTAEPTAVGIDLAAYSTSAADSVWVLVNKQHPIEPLDYEPADLVAFRGTTIRQVAAGDLEAMFAAAKADGVTLGVRTAYRGYDQQAAIRADVERRRGFEHAERYSARPGFSEHQTGLSLDLHSPSQPGCDLATCFSNTAEGQWVAAHAAEYGFVVRYTPENTDATGFSPEAWHLRYVGRELAAWLRDNGIGSLEEAFGVTGGPDYPS